MKYSVSRSDTLIRQENSLVGSRFDSPDQKKLRKQNNDRK
jgi:hypothetical protein